MDAPTIATERLVLRPWRDEDLPAFAVLNADPRVMEYLPCCLTPPQSDALVARIRASFDQYGFGLWAVEVSGVADFIGYVGLLVPGFEAAFTPCVEVGWRLAFDYWGRGYATEAARAAIAFGFERLCLPEIVSMTVPQNQRSWRVMERLGLVRSLADDFDHPNLPPGHPLRRHVLYRLSRERWQVLCGSEQPFVRPV